jgi:hypothetical protein
MQLSMTIGAMAVVLGVVLAGGYAIGEDGSQPVAPKLTIQKKVEDREAQRRAAVEEQQRRKDAFERACGKTLKSDAELEVCRTAYKRLDGG